MMKNKILFCGMIILILSLSLVFVGCDGDDDTGGGGSSGGTIKIINNNSSAITKVTVHYSGDTGRSDDEFTVNISANGGTWTQAISFSTPGMALNVKVNFGSEDANKSKTLMKGETKTFTLDADGRLTVD